MKQWKKLLMAVLAAAMMIGLTVTASAAPKLKKTQIVLVKGETQKLQVTGTEETVKWSSNKKKIAQVASDGTVTAKKKGTAVITAKIGKTKLTCKVLVEQPKLNKTKLVLNVKNTFQLKLTGTGQKIKWATNKKSVAAVKNGLITAKKKGTAVITATVGSAKFACNVIVENAKLSKKSLKLKEKSTAKLKLGGTSLKVKWSSKNKAVAKVSSSGLVTAVKVGSAEIVAKTSTGEYICKVTVEKLEIPVTEVTLSETSVSIETGESVDLTADYAPSNTTDDTTPKWTSSDITVATVSQTGKVTGISAGTATIKAVIGKKSASCKVSVVKPEVPVTEVILNETSLTLDNGETATLTAKYAPEDTTDDTTVIWTSSDEAVAKVSDTGKITTHSEGSTIIRATIGKVSASCKVTVLPTPADYFNKLINTIKASPRVNSDGNHFIRMDTRDSHDTEYNSAIIYDETNGTLKFTMLSENEEKETKTIVKMLMNISSTKSGMTVPVDYIFIYVDRGSFQTSVALRVSAYDGTSDIYFNLVNSTSSAWTETNTQNISNTALRLGFLDWNTLIQDYAGFSIKNIGFTNYDPS